MNWTPILLVSLAGAGGQPTPHHSPPAADISPPVLVSSPDGWGDLPDPVIRAGGTTVTPVKLGIPYAGPSYAEVLGRVLAGHRVALGVGVSPPSFVGWEAARCDDAPFTQGVWLCHLTATGPVADLVTTPTSAAAPPAAAPPAATREPDYRETVIYVGPGGEIGTRPLVVPLTPVIPAPAVAAPPPFDLPAPSTTRGTTVLPAAGTKTGWQAAGPTSARTPIGARLTALFGGTSGCVGFG